MRIICFKHVPFEGPAAITDWAESRGHQLDCVNVYAGEILPGEDSYDMLLVMGGPMNIHEESRYPWLVPEKAAIRRAIDADKVVVGICLGAQLIADLLGGSVTPGEAVEIGWFAIEKAGDCPLDLPLPDSLRVFHWHGDSFSIPDGASPMASTRACANQAFLYRGRVLGLQCHLEATPQSMNALIEACADAIGEGTQIQTAAAMRAEKLDTFKTMQTVLFELLDHISRNV